MTNKEEIKRLLDKVLERSREIIYMNKLLALQQEVEAKAPKEDVKVKKLKIYPNIKL